MNETQLRKLSSRVLSPVHVTIRARVLSHSPYQHELFISSWGGWAMASQGADIVQNVVLTGSLLSDPVAYHTWPESFDNALVTFHIS